MIDPGSVLTIIGSALSLWDSKEKNKYVDRLIKLKEQYYEEINRPQLDDAKLDSITRDISILCELCSAKIGASNTKTK